MTENTKPEVFLTICVPTYNRSSKIVKLVNSILLYDKKNIELIVLDNCSTDDTDVQLNKIIDGRFKYIRNEKNIGGIVNILEVLNLGSGEFTLLCLDKDQIDVLNISSLIEKLELNREIAFGQCTANLSNKLPDIFFDKGLPSLIAMPYSMEHPSGMILRKNILREENLIHKLIKDHSSFAFFPELIKSRFSCHGITCRINLPLISTETLENAEKQVSFTYNVNNLYFSPQSFIKTLKIFIEDAVNLNLTNKEEAIVIKKIYMTLLISSTLEYKKRMKDKSVCAHHGIPMQHIGLFELLRIYFIYNLFFFSTNIKINFLAKFKIFIKSHLEFLLKLLKRKK